MIMTWAADTPPVGWLMCDGQSYSTSTYSGLFAAIGYKYGGSGATFRVPDCRGRTQIGAGQGAGLAYRALGASGGAEAHALGLTELPNHTHIVNDGGHVHGVSDPTHAHSLWDPGHNHNLWQQPHAHGVADGGHGHAHYDPGHSHYYTYRTNTSGGAPGGGDSQPPWGWDGSWGEDYGVSFGHGWIVQNDYVHSSTRATDISIYAATTGIGIYGADANIGIDAATTSMAVYGAGTGVSITSARTGITLQATGDGAAHDNMMPFITFNTIIRAT
jgi:microcystin-dependent protein